MTLVLTEAHTAGTFMRVYGWYRHQTFKRDYIIAVGKVFTHQIPILE
jgi:hypothetical protein